jgi:Ribbon-helix-helix domain
MKKQVALCSRYVLYFLLRVSAWGVSMKSLVVKRSILIERHRASVSVEEVFWKSLKEIAALQDNELVGPGHQKQHQAGVR